MDILLVFGIAMLIAAAVVVVVSMPRRLGIVLLNWIPLVAFEYAPVLHYRTETGEDVEGTLPWAVGISPEIRACRTSLETHTPLTVYYDPTRPRPAGSVRARRSASAR